MKLRISLARGIWFVVGLAVLAGAGLAAGEEPPKPKPWALPEILRRIPPLKHDATGRWPMIAIEVFRQSADDKSFEAGKPLPPEMLKELLRRGLTQYIVPREQYIPYAKALQEAGSKVIIFEGMAFNGPPGDEFPDGSQLHQLPKDFVPDERPPQQPRYPCPLLFAGWQQYADKLRVTLRKFRDAGVKVDAAWLDWEVEPHAGESEWKEAKACARCRGMFPPGVLDDFPRYRAYIERLRNTIFSTYLAAPYRETWPAISVNNWEMVLSSPELATPSWSGRSTIPPCDLGLFTAANPVAYGNTAWYEINWKAEWGWPLDAAHMDRVYTAVMLGQLSGHEANAQRLAPTTEAVLWIDRYCADDRDPKIPMLTRARYREILRHLWLRGADAMQIFNPNWFPKEPAKEAIVVEELEDAVAVYDEMLAWRPFLDRGEVMNTAQVNPTDNGPLWSGLRLGDRAVVRAFTQNEKPVKLTFRPFAGGPEVELDAPPAGATYLLTLRDGKVKAAKQ